MRAARPVRAGGLRKRAGSNADTAPQADPTDKHDPAGGNGGNSRNGYRSTTVPTDVGPVQIAVPRDRDGSFEPKIVRKRQKRLSALNAFDITFDGRLSAGRQ
ncbi:hypothetical protein TH66_19150 [Carbonactinospora thermoautotrophica]|uniref:Mobile element protein n=1 Tax=Carbonactinospora thermoautotrophica TaxID=1469144 RepID=A0A132MIH7_9ACTN|nr:hypothetical protein TH66_19150 [Carbonactinospora thermoautotrophica]KWX00876.1 Mobile element protein [Carbonactinospora thermoautotrophica]KWX09638.1 hypothetical protein TR74_08395 [Carbonactinospora thermoautotrophica]